MRQYFPGNLIFLGLWGAATLIVMETSASPFWPAAALGLLLAALLVIPAALLFGLIANLVSRCFSQSPARNHSRPAILGR